MSSRASSPPKWKAPHVVPLDDSVRHEPSLTCVCRPEVGRIPVVGQFEITVAPQGLRLIDAKGTP